MKRYEKQERKGDNVKVYAVIDTNVLVSAMLTHNLESATTKTIEAIVTGKIQPLYNPEIIEEYEDVLYRKKFDLDDDDVSQMIRFIIQVGINVERTKSIEVFPDPSDAVFYEVALSKEGSFVVTGNLRHFPKSPIVVTPSEILEIIGL